MTRRVVLGPVALLGERGRHVFDVDGRPILVCATPAGTFALDDRCTHQDSALAEGRIKGCFIFCPLHGVRFDLRDGRPIGELTSIPVATYPVAIVDGVLEIQLDEALPHARAVFS